MKRYTLSLLLLLALACSATAGNLIQKGGFWNKRGYFQMRMGFIGGSGVELDQATRDGKPGFTFGASIEFRVGERWHLGIGGDVHRMHISDSGQYFLDVSASLKRFMFSEESKIAIRPGISLGYGTMDYFERILSWTDDEITVERIERTHFMVWKGTVEMVFYNDGHMAPYVEAGMMGTAYGGNDRHDLKFGPFPYARFGLMF